MLASTNHRGPVANWGLVGAAVYDASFKGPEIIDVPVGNGKLHLFDRRSDACAAY